MPFILTITFSFSYFEENIFYMICSTFKAGKIKYYFAKLAVGFMGNFLVIVIPYFMNIFLNYITFAENGNTVYGNKIDPIYYMNLTPETHMPFLEIYMEHEILYITVYTVSLGCLAGILGVFSCAAAGFIKRNKVFIFIPLYLLFYISQRYPKYLFGVNLERYVLLDGGGYSGSYFFDILLLCMALAGCSVLLVGILIKKRPYAVQEK